MRIMLIAVGCSLLLAFFALAVPLRPEEPLDLIVRGGRLLDGKGEKIFAADIGIRGGKITEIGFIETSARRTIDARGYWVTPGFVDLYSVPDRSMFEDTRWLGAVFQGVTTLVLDGEPGAYRPADAETAVPPHILLSRLQKDGMVLNAAAFVSLRQLYPPPPEAGSPASSKSDPSRLRLALEQAFGQGAAGLSYTMDRTNHSISKPELLELVRETASKGYACAAIMPAADNDPASLWNTSLEIAQTARARTLIHGFYEAAASHLDQVIPLIESARKTGADVIADFSPYSSGVPASEAETGVLRAIRLPWVAVGSGRPALSDENDPPEIRHPAIFGAFARALGTYTRQNHALSPSEYGNSEEMVRRMTSMPARFLGFPDRGRLAPGMAADIAIFHPEEFRDQATAEHPSRYASGVRWLLVNGALVLDDGKFTGAKPGRMLVPSRPAQSRKPSR